MKTSNLFPPNYSLILSFFPQCEERKAIFAYGDTIYNPFNVSISPDLEVHESVHAKQQGSNPEVWWIRYCSEPEFRLQQEIEAYGTQYSFVKRNTPNKYSDWLKEKLAEALSGPLYGSLLSKSSAESKIKRFARSISI